MPQTSKEKLLLYIELYNKGSFTPEEAEEYVDLGRFIIDAMSNMDHDKYFEK